MSSQGTWKENGSGKGSDHSRINKELFDAGWEQIFGKNRKAKENVRYSNDDAFESSERDD
jgi:hypothetical protein